MSSRRARQSASATPAVSRHSATLPAYQPPIAPLTAQSQAALERLANQDTLGLNDHFKKVNDELAQSVYNIHESLSNQEYWLRGRLQKAGGEDAKAKSRIAPLEALAERTIEMSAALEAKMRDAIDAHGRVRVQQDALREISGNVAGSGGRIAVPATQSTLGASQFRVRIDDEENEDEARTSGEDLGLSSAMGKKIREHDEKYAQLSMAERYAEHNDYIAFRRSLHDGKYASHEGQIPLLPHASTWFDADGPVLSQEKHNEESTQNNENEDSDLEAVGESVNVYCPLSRTIMTDPVRSRKCPHNFQRSAIEEVLRSSLIRVQGGGRHGTHAVQCPVCSVMLTADDLVPDPALKRRIERKVATQARNENGMDEDDEDEEGDGSAARRAQTVDSQFEPNLDHLMHIKAEARSGTERRSVVPATQKRESEEGGRGRVLPTHRSTTEVVDLDMDDSDEGE